MGKPEDDLEQAIFDLQDVKNNYLNEQKEFEKKIKTQEDWFKADDRLKAEMPPPAAVSNNFMTGGRPNTEGNMLTTNGFFKRQLNGVEGDLINDPLNNLEGELDNLTKDDLKERLIVAEKVMKSLFQRNKEIEDRANGEVRTSSTTAVDQQVVQCSNCKSLKSRIEAL